MRYSLASRNSQWFVKWVLCRRSCVYRAMRLCYKQLGPLDWTAAALVSASIGIEVRPITHGRPLRSTPSKSRKPEDGRSGSVKGINYEQ